jgi:protein-L-isoaspartate(D-aspartate) O-methyltransferase
MSDPDFSIQRESMVHRQIQRRGIFTPRVLEAFCCIPRHRFVPREDWAYAYDDCPLPIGLGQTISQPYIVALMTDLLKLRGDETVLEIGTGSGYQAALLSLLAQQVYTVERHAVLAQEAARRLTAAGINNVTVLTGDGSGGFPEYAPFQGILVTAAAPRVPEPLLEQLDVGGRLIIPVGSRSGQDLVIAQKSPAGCRLRSVSPVAFVPLRGEYGWKENEWQSYGE